MTPTTPLLLLLSLTSAAPRLCLASGGPDWVALVSEAEVSGTSIRLSDLLPDSVGEALRLEAKSIVVANSPGPGSTRVLPARQIRAALRDSKKLCESIQIPESIRIVRKSRMISSAEVLALVEAAGGRIDAPSQFIGQGSRFSGADELQIPQVPIAAEMELTLQGSHYEKRTGTTTLQLLARDPAPATSPSIMLMAILRNQISWHPRPSRPDQETTEQTAAPGNSRGFKSATTPILVQAGKAALGYLQGARWRIMRTVVPLHNGAMGEIVQVRDAGSREVLLGEVTGFSRLRLVSRSNSMNPGASAGKGRTRHD